MAAYDRFYKGDIAKEFVRGSQEVGGLHTAEDLAKWKVKIEEPVKTTYKGIDVYKLDVWTQGPAMLQALNILEGMDLKAMGYNSARYIHAIYQAMNLAFADRDFYYGDPAFQPAAAGRGPAVEGVRAGAREDDRLGEERPEREAGRPLPVPCARRTRTRICSPSGRRRRSRRWRGTSADSAELKTPDGMPFQLADVRGGVPRRHDVGRGRGRRRLGRLGDAERRLGPRGHRRQDRHRDEPAHAELRRRPGGEPVQRPRARQAPARDADADARAEGRQAVPVLLRPGRRQPGPEPPAVLPERRRVRNDAAGSDGGREHQQLPDAQLLRRPRVEAGRDGHPPVACRPTSAPSS